MLWLQYDPDLLNSFDSNPKRHLNYAARYSRSESLVDEEDAMLAHEAQPWNADLEGRHCSPHLSHILLLRLAFSISLPHPAPWLVQHW